MSIHVNFSEQEIARINVRVVNQNFDELILSLVQGIEANKLHFVDMSRFLIDRNEILIYLIEQNSDLESE